MLDFQFSASSDITMLATHCELVCEVDITFYSVSQKNQTATVNIT